MGINVVLDIVIGLIIAIIIAFIVTGAHKAALKSVRSEPEAKVYLRPGSLNLTKNVDRLTGVFVTKTPKQSSSSGGGGSSTHRSSSGRSHGGSSGRF